MENLNPRVCLYEDLESDPAKNNNLLKTVDRDWQSCRAGGGAKGGGKSGTHGTNEPRWLRLEVL